MAEVWATNVPSETERTITWKGDNYQEMMELIQRAFPTASVTFDLKENKVMLTRDVGGLITVWRTSTLELGEVITASKTAA